MSRPAGNGLSPWIESLLLSYGSQEGSSERLKANVVGVGQMTQSQAQGSKDPTGLLFLSDGVFRIPAILTASAWEHLQAQEDRECFTSLINTTVYMKDYQLHFHMAPEQTKCRFFLSVGELATTAAGPIKDNTPCCTTLPSIRLKICETWRALQGQKVPDSQKSLCRFDLSELLGEWQHDCLQDVLEDIRERLMVASSHPVSMQPSTSLLTHPDTSISTSWDVDRVTYKGVKCFSVPLKYLLIPEEDAQELQTPSNVGNRTPSGLSAASEDRARGLPQVCKPSETKQSSVDVEEWQIATPAVVETHNDSDENSALPVEDNIPLEDIIEGMFDSDIRSLSNPWDIFPPCDTTSPSDVSPEASPTDSLRNPTAAEPKTDHVVISTSTQLPIHSLKESWQTLEHRKGEHSYLPPYQKLPFSNSLPATNSLSTSVSLPQPFTRPANLLPATDAHCTDTAQQNILALDQESQNLEKNTEERVERKYQKAKRKRSEPTRGALTTLVEEGDEEAHISVSPPSWLFDTQAGSMAEEGGSHKQVQSVGTVLRNNRTVHSNGSPFYYSYNVCGQNLQDFSQFKVSESLLQWAVKYLVPKQTDNAHNTSLNSNQTSSDRTEVTSL